MEATCDHIDQPRYSLGLCRTCYSSYNYQLHADARKAYARKKYQEHKQQKDLANKKWSVDHPEYRLWIAAKTRAAKRNLAFDLDWRADIVIPSHCPVLGIPLLYGKGKPTHNSPTIDRIDNKKGYVKSNIIVVSYRANTLKRDGTLDELKKILNFYTALKEQNND